MGCHTPKQDTLILKGISPTEANILCLCTMDEKKMKPRENICLAHSKTDVIRNQHKEQNWEVRKKRKASLFKKPLVSHITTDSIF